MDDRGGSGPGANLECPQCANALKPIRTPDRITVYSCPSCRTVWLDGGAIADAGWGQGLPQPMTSQPSEVSCPRCGKRLLALGYESSRGEVRVEYCESCNGMSVAQAHMVALRELAATTGSARASSNDTAEGADAGQPADTVTFPPAGPVAEGRSGRTGLILVLCAVLVAAGVYVLRQRGAFSGDSAPAVTEPAIRSSVEHDLDPFFAVIPALKRYYEAFGRWPVDAEDLDRFSRERVLSFDLSKFDRLTWEPKVTGGLIIKYRIKGARGSRTFHISRPARRQPVEQ